MYMWNLIAIIAVVVDSGGVWQKQNLLSYVPGRLACCTLTSIKSSVVVKTFFKTKTKTKTMPSVQDQDQDFASQDQDQDQDLFVVYTRGWPKSIFHFGRKQKYRRKWKENEHSFSAEKNENESHLIIFVFFSFSYIQSPSQPYNAPPIPRPVSPFCSFFCRWSLLTAISLAIPPWVGAMSTGDGYGHR